MFERFYKQHLGKRLLLGKVTSDDAERALLSKLKTECGYQFTSKLEQMFTDIKTSADTGTQFKAYLADTRTALPCDLSVQARVCVYTDSAARSQRQRSAAARRALPEAERSCAQVLTTGSWPTTSAAMCALPVELEHSTRVFQEFYRTTHSGRNLAWHTSMGTADLRATFSGRKKEINVTTYQMCLLMLFNDQPNITFAELQTVRAETWLRPRLPWPPAHCRQTVLMRRTRSQGSQIGRDELKRALQGLCMVKGKNLLRKEPSGRDIADGDVFCVNDAFDSRMFKIKFAAAGAQKEARAGSGTARALAHHAPTLDTPTYPQADPERGTRGRVEEDRKHHIEAAIVRIMKARKARLARANLTSHLTSHLLPSPFRPSRCWTTTA